VNECREGTIPPGTAEPADKTAIDERGIKEEVTPQIF
jgi:hypothetical protein